MPFSGIIRIRLRGLFILALLLLPALVSAEAILRDERVVVRFDPPLNKVAAEVFGSCRGLLDELRGDLGTDAGVRFEIHLIRDHSSFRNTAGSDLVSAIALPSRNLIVIDYSKMGVHPFTLRTTLKHEICHLELHHLVENRGLARWFDEGICQWVTGGFSEIISDRRYSDLGNASLAERLIPLEQLSVSFPGDTGGMTLAYAESRSIIEFMEKKYGKEGIRSIIASLGSDDDLELAILKATGRTLDELQAGWLKSVGPKQVWPYFLRDYLYEALFLLAALLCICAFFRILRKKREYRDEPDEEETDLPDKPEKTC